MKKKTKSYALGGTIGALAGNLLLPGIGGTIGGTLGGIADQFFAPSNYNFNSAATANSNPYGNGYAMGGSISKLSPTSIEVTGAPGKTDGNHLNINGTPIKADHGEVIDTSKQIVFSDMLFDPRTGDKFSDSAKKIEKAANKVKTPSVLNQNTTKALDRLKTSLFQTQEQVAQAIGVRDEPNPLGASKPSFGMG